MKSPDRRSWDKSFREALKLFEDAEVKVCELHGPRDVDELESNRVGPARPIENANARRHQVFIFDARKAARRS